MAVVEVPGSDLIAFIAEHVRAERIRQLEDATTSEVLGIPEPA